jgi:hypothetical protein
MNVPQHSLSVANQSGQVVSNLLPLTTPGVDSRGQLPEGLPEVFRGSNECGFPSTFRHIAEYRIKVNLQAKSAERRYGVPCAALSVLLRLIRSGGRVSYAA